MRLGAIGCAVTLALLVQGCAATPPPGRSVVIERQGSFEAGGTLLGQAGSSSLSCDHGHVEYQVPVRARRHAMFLWHSSSAAVWQRNWAGGEGFQSKLLRRGYPTYVWDGPRVGRANWGCAPYGYAAEPGRDEASFTAWRLGPKPGTFYPGVQFPVGDAAAFDQAMRSRYAEFDTVANARLEARAAAVAIDRIGPSVLLTNSAGGLRALLAALDTEAITGIVAYENPGFVFPQSAGITMPEGPYGPVIVSDAQFARLTRIPMQFVWGDHVAESEAWRPLFALCQQFVRTVNERGGKAEILVLSDAGLKGNTHLPFADLNNEGVATELDKWLARNRLDR